MNPVNGKSNTYIDSKKEVIDKDLKFKISDIVAPAASANKRGGILALPHVRIKEYFSSFSYFLFDDDDDDDDDELFLWYG